jgi:hypothetical protein
MRVALWDILKASLILLSLGGSLFLFSMLKRPKVELLAVVIMALTTADLAQFGSRYLVTFNPRDLYMDEDLRAFLKGDHEPFRVATPILRLLNQGLLDGIENVGGYDAIVLRNYNEFLNFAQQLPIDEPDIVMRLHRISPLLNLINVKYYIVDNGMSIELPTVERVFQSPAYNVYRNNDALPRSFVVHDVRVIKERNEVFQFIMSPQFAPPSSATVAEPMETVLSHPWVQSPLPKVVDHSHNRVAIQADLKEQGLLVLADAYYPGWKAFVDGEETKIYQTNYVMRGVLVPAGSHRVEFRYDPISFRIGLIVSLATLVLVLGFLIWDRARRSPKF